MRIAALVAGSVLLAAPMSFAQSVDHMQVPAMLGWINAARAQHGAPALTEDPRLDALAESHSMDMATHHFFNHVSPTQGAPSQRASAAGIAYRELAENIALDQSPRAAFDALMHSPGHYANLMNPGLHAVGLGLVTAPDGVYVTQSFATFDDGAQPAITPIPGVSITPIAPPAAPVPSTAPPGATLPNIDLGAVQGLVGSVLQGARGTNALPLPGNLPSVPSLADLARLAQSSNLPVHVTPRRGPHGQTAYDVQTPYGTFRVFAVDDAPAPPPPAPMASAAQPTAPDEPSAQPCPSGAQAPAEQQPWTGSF